MGSVVHVERHVGADCLGLLSARSLHFAVASVEKMDVVMLDEGWVFVDATVVVNRLVA
jgi:hypothetical protein